MSTFLSFSPDDLPEAAKAFLETYPHGGLFLLNGEMGAGKTTFVRTVCALLDTEGAASPTFSLINQYESKTGVKVWHMDLYRIKNLEEALDFGIEEYLDRPGYVFIEWPEHIRPLLHGEGHEISITLSNPGRILSF